MLLKTPFEGLVMQGLQDYTVFLSAAHAQALTHLVNLFRSGRLEKRNLGVTEELVLELSRHERQSPPFNIIVLHSSSCHEGLDLVSWWLLCMVFPLTTPSKPFSTTPINVSGRKTSDALSHRLPARSSFTGPSPKLPARTSRMFLEFHPMFASI